MALTWPSKDPDEVLDFTWSVPVDAEDTLSSATLTVIDGSAVIDSQDDADGALVAFISGGTDGEVTSFRAIATTSGGRTYEETIYLPIVASGSAFAGEFSAAFPAFATVPAAAIAFWKAQADLVVDPLADCLGARADLARMLATAHYLCQQGLGTGTDSQLPQGIRRIKSGTLEIERVAKADSASMGDWGSTSYGQQLFPMLKACTAGPRVTATGALPCGGAFNGFAGPLPPWGRC